jgi:hypothetical protein
VLLFVTMMSICCMSSLLSKDTATHSNLTQLKFHLFGDSSYSAQQALTLSITLGVFFGMALAGFGLGFQAQSRSTPIWAAIVTAFATIFWILQMLAFARFGLVFFAICCALLAILHGACFGFSFGAMKDMWRNPPPVGFEYLPKDYKVPYSHMHQDPPDVRYAAELDARRRKLQVQQAELEMLEQKLKRRMKENGK